MGQYQLKDIVVLNDPMLEVRPDSEASSNEHCQMGNPDYQYCYTCEDKYTENRRYGLCRPCDDNCEKCQVADQCLVCSEHHFIGDDGKCKKSQPYLWAGLALLGIVFLVAAYKILKYEKKQYRKRKRLRRLQNAEAIISERIVKFNKDVPLLDYL